VLRYVRQQELIDEFERRNNIEPITRDFLTQLVNRRFFEARAAELEYSKSPYLDCAH